MFDDFSAQYSQIANLALNGQTEEARTMLRNISGRQSQNNGGRIGISKRVQVEVFTRDRYTCRYCGRRTVFPPVLRALSILFAPDFPYHLHGKMTECHIAFWRDIASCDHLVPVARGGSSEPQNLTTTCYMCNSIKQNWLLDELRWNCNPIPTSDWDGLSSIYPQLIRKLPNPAASYFLEWEQALKRRIATVAAG